MCGYANVQILGVRMYKCAKSNHAVYLHICTSAYLHINNSYENFRVG